MGDFLIDGIWILRQYSGVCLFEEIYTDLKKGGISKDLITGFLSAIVSFAEEAFRDELKNIKFTKYKILLEFTKEVIIVVAISIQNLPVSTELKKNLKIEIKETIKKIVNRFNEKYLHYLGEDLWQGNVSLFDAFSEDLREIVKREPMSIKLIMLKQNLRKRKRQATRRIQRKQEVKRIEKS